MYIEQIYTNCLAHAAYYVESHGEAAIIDPLRDVKPYMEMATKRGAKIKYVLETHFHADFVSGHIDLANETGAKIIYGPSAKANFEITAATDHQKLPLGNLVLEVLHTPGHTLESSCFLLYDANNQPHCIFTGDTLFVGDVGRPDLAVKSDLTREQLASYMYDSINNVIKTLPPQLIVYPGHGAGSACGKSIGKETTTTIADQLKFNYALQPMSREVFIQTLIEGQCDPPKYFFRDATINKDGYDNIDTILNRNNKPLSLTEFKQFSENGTVILDCRNANDFGSGYIPGSINVGLNGQYAIWVGSLLDLEQPLILICEKNKEQEAILRLARVGFENVKGYLKGGIEEWKKAGEKTLTIESIDAQEFGNRITQQKTAILDVRNPTEWANGIVPNAQLISLANLENSLNSLNPNQQYLIYCGGGYRSMIASSILARHSFTPPINILGGYAQIKENPNIPSLIPQK